MANCRVCSSFAASAAEFVEVVVVVAMSHLRKITVRTANYMPPAAVTHYSLLII
jgi:hypothetical protein